MAAADRFDIMLMGRGGHAAEPHLTQDVVLAAAEIVLQLNTIVSRRIDPAAQAVLSVTRIEGGMTHNVIPTQISLTGTIRSFDPAVQDVLEFELRRIVQHAAEAIGAQAKVDYVRYYPATVNDSTCAARAIRAARGIFDPVLSDLAASFTAEDFSFLLQRRPGAYVWLGQGRGEDVIPLHDPRYDFNDDLLPLGMAWFAAITEQELSA
jgi:hippurate hydrolase